MMLYKQIILVLFVLFITKYLYNPEYNKYSVSTDRNFTAFISKPENCTEETPCPAMILLHNDNDYNELDKYSEIVERNDIVTFNMYGSDKFHAYSGLNYTSTLPFVDKTKIGVIGKFVAGNAALYSGYSTHLFKIDNQFKFHVAIDPICYVSQLPQLSKVWTNNPVLIFIENENNSTDECFKLISTIYGDEKSLHEKRNKKLFIFNSDSITDTVDMTNSTDVVNNITNINRNRLTDHMLETFEIELLSALKPESLH